MSHGSAEQEALQIHRVRLATVANGNVPPREVFPVPISSTDWVVRTCREVSYVAETVFSTILTPHAEPPCVTVVSHFSRFREVLVVLERHSLAEVTPIQVRCSLVEPATMVGRVDSFSQIVERPVTDTSHDVEDGYLIFKAGIGFLDSQDHPVIPVIGLIPLTVAVVNSHGVDSRLLGMVETTAFPLATVLMGFTVVML